MFLSSTAMFASSSIFAEVTGPGRVHDQRDGLRLVAVQLERHLFEVQDDVGGVFDNARNRRKFVQHALDLDGRDGRAFDGAQQSAPQGVSNRGSPASLERLRGKLSVLIGQCLRLGRQALRLLKSLPHISIPPGPPAADLTNYST
jgi:hypothetical protein